MKLETTLPEGVGFLHAIPLFNLFAVLLMCHAVGPLLEEKTGVAVDMPTSMFQIERYQEAAVITLMAQGNQQMYLGTQACTMVELDQLLGKTIDKGVAPDAVVVIKADRMVSSESLRQVAEVCLRKGLKVVLAGGGRRTSLQEASQ